MADGYISQITLPDTTTYDIKAKAADISSVKMGIAYFSNTAGILGSTTAGLNGAIFTGQGTTTAPTWTPSKNGAVYATTANGDLEWGTLPVKQGGTGFTSTSYINAVVIGNSSNAGNALQTVQTDDGAFYATSENDKPKFGTLPIPQGGTGSSATPTKFGIIYAATTASYASTTAGNEGLVIIGNGSSTAPEWYSGLTLSGTTSNSYKATFSNEIEVNGKSKLTGRVGIGTDPDNTTSEDQHILTIKGNTKILNTTGALVAHIDTNTSDNLIEIYPDTTNNGSLGLGGNSPKRWKTIYVGTADTYGSTYTPIYWNDGVPAVVYPVQRINFTFSTSHPSPISVTHSAITLNTQVTEIVVESGMSYLNSSISWTVTSVSSVPTLKLLATTNVSSDQSITGYIMISNIGNALNI